MDTQLFPAAHGQFQPKVRIFSTQEELEQYVEEELNEKGHSPQLGVVDQHDDHWFACRAAPGGDGYSFYFILIDPDTGFVHECNGEETGCSSTQCSLMGTGYSSSDAGPDFPVMALVRNSD